ncbi:ABC transporter substrate-binding protein [Snodgrassella sp.]|uniref:heme/hemin ABC transporter substrate-binding protein n=1 Tax=Snodgrassella sp. TaxID=2815304 RepID=UPI002589660C|nr:ABC transporter substrate-binding protein [Snodgrassella sp.]MCO6518006.1 ABC transporter substrate-binding protein [Snodgrassella sp.]
MKRLFLAAAMCAAFPFAFAARIVTLTPDVADVVVELGGTKDVVGREMASTNPALKNVPSIGLFHGLSVEPIAARKPTLVLGSWMAQPASIYANLNRVGIMAVNVAPKEDINGYAAGIRKVGQLIGKSSEANALASRWLSQVKEMPKTGKRYLISYDGRYVSGRGTAADELIRRAGGINAAAAIEGMKPMSREAWVAAKPDIILIAERNQKLVGGMQGLAKRPEIAASPAVKQNKIYFMPSNDLFRYGLNTPQVISKLYKLAQ